MTVNPEKNGGIVKFPYFFYLWQKQPNNKVTLNKYLILLIIILSGYSCRKLSTDKSFIRSTQSDTQAMYYYKKADTFYFKSRYDSSFYYYNKALKLFQKKNDSLMTAKIYIDLGTLDILFHNYTGVENNVIKALTYLNDKNIDEKARAYNILAINSKNKKDFDKAEKYFRLYRNIYLNKKDTLEEYVIFTGNIANLYLKKEDYNKSKPLLEQLIQNDSVKEKFPLKYARALNNLGKLYLQLNEPEKAFENINKALQIRMKLKQTSAVIQSYLSMALYYLKKGDRNRSGIFARKALDLSEKTNSISNKMQAFTLLFKTMNKPVPDLFNQYKQLQDSLIDMERSYKDQAALIKFETIQKEKALFKKQQELKLKNKRNKWLLILLSVLIIAFLIVVYQYGIIRRKNTALSEKNFFINKLFQEMHHRIKNNFEMINLFINDIVKINKDHSIAPFLVDLSGKVNSFKKLHLLLKEKDISTSYELKSFVDEIFNSIKTSFGKEIELENHLSKDVKFEFSKIIYLGLFVNEFITNSFKYAFDDFSNAKITVEMEEKSGQYRFILRDNGKGLPENYDWKNSNSFGMKYFSIIEMYLRGKLSLKNDNGFVIQMDFSE